MPHMSSPISAAIPAALHAATLSLTPVSCTARLDAELLMAFALGIGRGDMLMRMRDLELPAAFDIYVARRMAHEPVAYITGTQAFWDLELIVTPDVLIPRADSETLIDAAKNSFAMREPPVRILDLGTGSGALLLAALSLFPAAIGLGIDASDAALLVAKRNADALSYTGALVYDDRARFALLDWQTDGWEAQLGAPYDLILCNPPYIEQGEILSPMVMEYEPHTALFAGDDGLNDYRLLLPHIGTLLSQNGIAVFEIGYNQGDSVAQLATEFGLNSLLSHDLAGNPRCLTLRIQ